MKFHRFIGHVSPSQTDVCTDTQPTQNSKESPVSTSQPMQISTPPDQIMTMNDYKGLRFYSDLTKLATVITISSSATLFLPNKLEPDLSIPKSYILILTAMSLTTLL